VPYPNNSTEIPIILNDYIVKKTREDIDFFFLTDSSVIPAFQTIIPENEFKKEICKEYSFHLKFQNTFTYINEFIIELAHIKLHQKKLVFIKKLCYYHFIVKKHT